VPYMNILINICMNLLTDDIKNTISKYIKYDVNIKRKR